MPPSSQKEVYDQLATLLAPPTAFPAGRYRPSSDVSDGLKRVRRIILTEGIPEVVSAIYASWITMREEHFQELAV